MVIIHNNTVVGRAKWDIFANWNFPRIPYMMRLQNNIHEVSTDDSLAVGSVRVNNQWQSGGTVEIIETEGVQLLKEFADLRGIRPELVKTFMMDYVSARNVTRRFQAGLNVAIKDIIWYRNTLYRCIQAHTTQSDWTPDITPAIWGKVPYPGIIPEWSWYDKDTLYLIIEAGDKVTHNDTIYYSANPTFSWIEPGGQDGHYGWSLTINN